MAIDINIATTFLGNTDTPSTYVGQGGKVVSVKVDASGLEFTTVQGGGNIYTENGTLTGNRTVTHNGYTLTFNGTTRVQSPGASSIDTAFAVRNNDDNANLFQVLGDGSVFSKGKNNLSENTAYGETSLASITTGNFNTGYGYLALSVATVGQGNTALGRRSLASLVDGNNNVGVGSGAGKSISSGSSNVGIGSFALDNLRTGNLNLAIGQNSMVSCSASVSNNTAIGFQTLQSVSGNLNLAVGFATGQTIISGQQNNLFGYLAGEGITTGSFNTIIGSSATQPATLSNSVIIGKDAVATGDNQFVVGSSGTNAGTVTTEGFTQALTWRVKINGVDYKIPLELA